MQDYLKACSEPLEVTPMDGEVVITGPDGVAISLTREAAVTSAKRLWEAAKAEEPDAIYQKRLG